MLLVTLFPTANLHSWWWGNGCRWWVLVLTSVMAFLQGKNRLPVPPQTHTHTHTHTHTFCPLTLKPGAARFGTHPVAGAIWNTWGPIAPAIGPVFSLDDNEIALLANWGPICYLLFVFVAAWLIDVKGLRSAMLVTMVPTPLSLPPSPFLAPRHPSLRM